jgi:Helix-turn-helix domain
MADPGESLTDIALACGFADQSHFSRVFKQILRLSPGNWRRYYVGPSGASGAGTSAKTAGKRKSASQPTAVDDGNSALSDAALESAQSGSRRPVVLILEN